MQIMFAPTWSNKLQYNHYEMLAKHMNTLIKCGLNIPFNLTQITDKCIIKNLFQLTHGPIQARSREAPAVPWTPSAFYSPKTEELTFLKKKTLLDIHFNSVKLCALIFFTKASVSRIKILGITIVLLGWWIKELIGPANARTEQFLITVRLISPFIHPPQMVTVYRKSFNLLIPYTNFYRSLRYLIDKAIQNTCTLFFYTQSHYCIGIAESAPLNPKRRVEHARSLCPLGICGIGIRQMRK